MLAERDEEEALALGELDITTESLSLAGVEKEIEAFADSEVLRAILDQGALSLGARKWAVARGGAGSDQGSAALQQRAAAAGTRATPPTWCARRRRHQGVQPAV